MRKPVVVITGARRRAGKRIGDHLEDAGWDVVRWEHGSPLPVAVDAVVHVDGDDAMTRALTDLGATVIVVLAQPGRDHTETVAWCDGREVEIVLIDATKKVHELAPLVRATLSG